MIPCFDKKYVSAEYFKPTFCKCYILLCIILFIIEIQQNNWKFESFSINPTLGPSIEVLLKLGAKDSNLIKNNFQIYRIFTPMFLHSGVTHLIFNMVALRNIGIPLEKEFGCLKMFLISIFSGIIGILCSCILSPSGIVGVGASGTIFGLLGATWSDLIMNWKLFYSPKKYLFILCFTTFLNLSLGLLPFLDNFSHIGGFISGICMGIPLLGLYRTSPYRNKLTIFKVSFCSLIIIIGLSLFLFLSNSNINDMCPWCKYLSCIPFPPGEGVKWWDCDTCVKSVGEIINGNNLTILCPDNNETKNRGLRPR